MPGPCCHLNIAEWLLAHKSYFIKKNKHYGPVKLILNLLCGLLLVAGGEGLLSAKWEQNFN